MSLDDFLAISPSEFTEVYEKWLEIEQQRDRNDWDRARWQVFKTLCPPEKKSITIFDIEEFPWDPKRPKAPRSTRERFDELTKKHGQRIQTGDRDSSKL